MTRRLSGGRSRGWAAPAPPPPEVVGGRQTLVEEILIVLALSLLASAVYSIIDLATAPISGVSVAVYPVAPFATQLAEIVFGLAPVYLVVHLARRSAEPIDDFGLGTSRLGSDVAWGLLLAAIVATVGLGFYFGSVALNVNRFVNPAPPLHHWWTVPILILGAIEAGLLEEIVVVGYLVTRLQQLAVAGAVAVCTSALLRGSYHLYQGWGGFAGNLALGLFFGAIFLRWRRTWPLVVAHATIDTLAGLGYILFHTHLPGG